jgi:hypothetical protein
MAISNKKSAARRRKAFGRRSRAAKHVLSAAVTHPLSAQLDTPTGPLHQHRMSPEQVRQFWAALGHLRRALNASKTSLSILAAMACAATTITVSA